MRAIEQEKKVHQELNAYEKKIVNAYLKAQKYLSSEVKKIYSRYLNKSGLTESEVERILNSTVSLEELTELKALANSIEDQGIKKQAQDYLNGLAVKHRITRLEDLKAKSYLVSKQLADVQLKQSTDYYIKAVEDAYTQAAAESIVNQVEQVYESYNDGEYPSYTIQDDRVIEDIYVKMQKDKAITEFKELSTEQTKHILDGDWKGSNYSKRIWKDTDLLAEKLEEMFTVKQLTGMSEREIVKELVKQFEVSTGIAERLLRTEANYMTMQAKLKGWKEHGVEEYILVAVLDFKTSNICQSMDGKRFKVEEAVVNGKEGNYPPFHPWCRTVAIAYFGKRSLDGKRTANDPVTGKTFTINQSDTYKDWEKMLLDKHGQSDLDSKKKKVKNYKSDLEQYRRYQDVIGEKYVPKSFDDFQEMKYNKGEGWTRLQDHYFVKSRLNDGRYGTVINPEKQAPHMKSTRVGGRSYFPDDVDVQKLFDKYAGTGKVEKTEAGRRTNKEIIYINENIGIDGSSKEVARGIKIHHSKNRTHIVPWKGAD